MLLLLVLRAAGLVKALLTPALSQLSLESLPLLSKLPSGQITLSEGSR